MFNLKNIGQKITILIGFLFIVNFLFILYNLMDPVDINGIQTLALICTLAVTVWLAHQSPAAIAAKIKKREYLQKKRQEHYKTLALEIIKPISETFVKQKENLPEFKKIDDFFILNYDLTVIKNNPYYWRTISHLNKDYGNFEELLTNLEQGIKEHNKSVIKIREELETNITRELISLGYTITDNPNRDKESIFLKEIIDVITQELNLISSKNAPENENLSLTTSKISSLEEKYSIQQDESSLKVGQQTIIKTIKPEAKSQIVSIIEKYSRDDKLLKKLMKLKKDVDNYIKKSKDISEKCENVDKLIFKKEYSTISSCCPQL